MGLPSNSRDPLAYFYAGNVYAMRIMTTKKDKTEDWCKPWYGIVSKKVPGVSGYGD
jgi:hypothetical protein